MCVHTDGCPFCKSTKIIEDFFNPLNSVNEIVMECYGCGRKWVHVCGSD